MEFPGHVGVALAAYAPFVFATTVLWTPQVALAGTVVTVSLASLPDGDHYVPRLNHRGYAHTVWFAFAVGIGCAGVFAIVGVAHLAAPGYALGAFGFVVGTIAILSHVAADSLTPMGVEPFAPVSRRRFSFGVTRSVDPTANRRLLLAGVVVTFLAFALGGFASTAW